MSKVEEVAKARNTVWVGYQEDGYDGCSEPLAVFATKFLAEIWLSGAGAAQSRRCKAIELPVLDAALSEEGR